MAQTNLATADLDEGFDVTLYNPVTGEDTDVVIRVMVGGSAIFHKTMAERERAGLPYPRNRYGLYKPETAAAMVISWDNVCIGGRVIECTYDNAVMVYTKYPWVLQQVFDATAHLYGYVDWMHYLDRFNRGKIPQFRARKWVAFNKLAALGDFKAAADAGAFNPGCLELRPRSPGQAVRGLALLDFEASLLDPLCVGLELRPHGRLPLWDGRPIKRLVVIGAAPGDQFVMGRYLRGLCERAEHVSVITEHSLVALCY